MRRFADSRWQERKPLQHPIRKEKRTAKPIKRVNEKEFPIKGTPVLRSV